MITPLQNLLLENRGIFSFEEKEKFLNPVYERDIYCPFLMKDMEKAISRLFESVTKGEKIVVFSDYDCDGIPGAALFYNFFQKIKYPIVENFSDFLFHPAPSVYFYIPYRNGEGYGLNQEAINEFIQAKVKLLITVDLGISDYHEVLLAQKNGIDCIISDHHLPKGNIPPAYAILNPKIKDDPYPEKNLCGAGVAFKFIDGFIKKFGEKFGIIPGWEKWLLDLVAIATIADQVPLVSENRVLAFFGLIVLRKNKRLGLKKFWEKYRINPEKINEDDILFNLAPKINTAGRIDDPSVALKLLTSRNEKEIEKIISLLNEMNEKRKTIVSQIFKEAKKKIGHPQEFSKNIIITGSPKWQPSLLSIVASKLSEEYKKPVFIWGKEIDCFKGSCRVFEEVEVFYQEQRTKTRINLVELMQLIPNDMFSEFGGHEFAGGFSIPFEKIHLLEQKLSEALENYLEKIKNFDQKEENLKEKWDKKLTFEEINLEIWEEIEKLRPFGNGNPPPLFLFENVYPESFRNFGKGKEHLEITFIQNNRKMKSIFFYRKAEEMRFLFEKQKLNILANFERDFSGLLRLANVIFLKR